MMSTSPWSYVQLLQEMERISPHPPHQPPTKIIVVSKWQTPDEIRNLWDQGARCFGENYVQEALPKMESLKDLAIEWHFVGRLQKNKVKQIVGKFSWIHSVDSLSLAQTIQKEAQSRGITQKVLLQVNLGNESSKAGLPWDSQNQSLPKNIEEDLVRELTLWTHLCIGGWMALPPPTKDPQTRSSHFRNLKFFQERWNHEHGLHFQELSMGTSEDWKWALMEGATMIRIGSLLFGERRKKI